MPDDDPFADGHPGDGVSPAETIRMPEFVYACYSFYVCASKISSSRPLDPRSPREEPFQPVISMPLPAMQEVIPGQ